MVLPARLEPGLGLLPDQAKEIAMTGTNGTHSAGNHANLLRLFLAIEEAKDAIRRFEEGEINIHEAIRRLTTATVSRNAAA